MDFVAALAQVELEFSPATSNSEKVAKFWELLEQSRQASTVSHIRATSNIPDDGHPQVLHDADVMMEAVSRNGIQTEWLEKLFSSSMIIDDKTRRRPPLSRLPCANQDPNVPRICDNAATRFCSACRLVGYCSKTCQKQHWLAHKKDCKDPLRNANWQPDWVTEARAPAFLAPSHLTGWSRHARFGMGQSLWGNMPALDIINATSNEGMDAVLRRDLNLAFVASGDLRHVVRTINALPKDYAGRLSICLNDRSGLIVLRNIVLLGVLGRVPDISEAAEYALHIWYSIFLPAAYTVHVAPMIHKLLNDVLSTTESTVDFTPSSKLTIVVSREIHGAYRMFYGGPTPSPGQANDTFTHLMNAPERVDYRHRYFVRLQPSNRLAMSEWRRSGIILPFGAPNAHLNTPNRWLIGSGGRFFMDDSANPLNGWNIDDVIESGQRHGATKEDIVGCLFFHVRQQLAEFAARLRRFNISIKISAIDARKLARELRSSPDFVQGFDRVEVSNIADKEYVGVSGVLEDWGPLLRKDHKHAAIVGTFMNWPMEVPSAHGESLSMHVATRYVRDIINEHYKDSMLIPLRGDDPRWSVLTMSAVASIDLKLENSSSFLTYLKKFRADEAAQRVGLRRRRRNQIVAPRPFTALGSGIDALPDVKDAEKWYRASALSGLTSLERYVEWVRA